MDPANNTTSKPDQTLDDSARPLVEAGPQDWTSDDLKAINARYTALLDEIFVSANLSVEQYQKLSNSNRSWRRRLILGTGIVAIVNLLAAHKIPESFPRLHNLNWLLPIVAAVVAAILAILANLESFYNFSERAQAYRESRDIFLDAGRDFVRLWDSYVNPLGDSPAAYSNAAELYRRLVAKDRELRRKFKELTETASKGGKGVGT
jgi:hypothetical protein